MAYEREATVKPGIDKPRGNARRRYQTAQQYICIENDAHQRSGAMLGPGRATDSAKFDLDNPLDLSRIGVGRSEEHTSELQSLMRNSYAVFCLNKNKPLQHTPHSHYPS